MESYQGLTLFIQIITFIGGFIVFLRGYEEYRRTSRTKRAEFLEKLIAEFNSPSMQLAKDILEDYLYPYYSESTLQTWGDLEHFPSVNIEHTLRYHKIESIEDEDEIKIREAFDNLLDFFTKISYYQRNELITEEELSYFSYYFRRMEKPPYQQAISNYINYYFNKEDFERLGIQLLTPAPAVN